MHFQANKNQENGILEHQQDKNNDVCLLITSNQEILRKQVRCWDNQKMVMEETSKEDHYHSEIQGEAEEI